MWLKASFLLSRKSTEKMRTNGQPLSVRLQFAVNGVAEHSLKISQRESIPEFEGIMAGKNWQTIDKCITPRRGLKVWTLCFWAYLVRKKSENDWAFVIYAFGPACSEFADNTIFQESVHEGKQKNKAATLGWN